MLRAALWALRAQRRTWQVVGENQLEAPLRLPSAPSVPITCSRAVLAVLSRTRATCLVQSLVLQRWFADHGQEFDVVIGVTAPSDGFRAHAWLDRPGEVGGEDYTELHRVPASHEATLRSAGSAVLAP